MFARFAKLILLTLVFPAALPSGLLLGQQSGETQAEVVGVSFFQETEEGADSIQGDPDLDQDFGKLEIRLRELEDDFESHSDDAEKIAETSQDTAKQTAESLEQLNLNVQSLNESVCDLEGTLPTLVRHNHLQPGLTLFGRIQTDYWAFPAIEPGIEQLEGENPQDRFIIRRLRLGVEGDLNDNMFYRYEGEFANQNLQSYSDAYLGFRHLPLLNTVIIGNQKRPYGLDGLNSSTCNVFMERPLIIEANNFELRRLGVSSNGYSDNLKYNWRYGIWNQQPHFIDDPFGYVGDHYQLELASRGAWTPWYDECSGGRGYCHLAISNSIGYPDGRGGPNNTSQYRTRPEAFTNLPWLDTGTIDGANTNSLIGLESVVNFGPTQLVAEFQRSDVDRSAPFGPDLTFHGGYFYVAHFLTGEHMPWNRETGTLDRIQPFENFFRVRDCDCNIQRGLGAWQIAARYSYADLNDLDIVGGEASALTLGLNWYWNPYARMQFNYINGDVKRDPLGSGDYEIFGVRFMIDF